MALPVPTPKAWATAALAIGFLLLGVFREAPLATSVGAWLATTLAALFAATGPMGRRARRQRLEFAWWRAHVATGPVHAGAAVPIHCYLRHQSRARLWVRRPSPRAPTGILLGPCARAFSVPPSTRADFSFTVTPRAAGRWVLQGLALELDGPWGFFFVPLYFPNPLTLTAWPAPQRLRLPAVVGSPPRAQMRLRAPTRASPTRDRHQQGTELAEIRDFVPGDPFRTIAWKPSARRGSLLVRVMHPETIASVWLIVEVGGTMRDGPPGERRLDVALSLGAAMSKGCRRGEVALGLLTVDRRVVHRIAPGFGQQHATRIMEALTEVPNLADADLTAIDDESLEALVGTYVLAQFGRDYLRPDGTWHGEALERHIRSLGAGTPAGASAGTVYRDFCRAHGIALPYPTAPFLPGEKELALSKAMLDATVRSQHTAIYVVTDFDAISKMDVLRVAATAALRRRVAVTFVVPAAPAARAGAQDEDDACLRAPYLLAEQRKLRMAHAALRGVATVTTVDALPQPLERKRSS